MNITPKNVDTVIVKILQDPATSFWLRDTLTTALQRDPVDAANDAEVMNAVLAARCTKILEGGL